MLTSAGTRTVAGGNIGKPYSEIVREGHPLDVITLEVSSFQFERIQKFRPAISVWLNLTPDHLDRYDGTRRIPRRQTADFREPDRRRIGQS